MLSVCPHDCPSACSLVVKTENGRIVDVTGNPEHPFTQGVICGKVRAYAERVHSPLRVQQPLRRVGPKGVWGSVAPEARLCGAGPPSSSIAGEFAPISWPEAIDMIAARWRQIIAESGAEAILPFSYAGTMGQVQYFAGHPLFHALGASRLHRTICVETAYAGWRATLGAVTGNDSNQMVGSDLVVLWGINAAYSTINVMTLVKQARAAGAYVMCLDPYRTPTAEQADEHLMVRPGTDGALALAMMHVLIAENLVDHAYIARATLGFDKLAAHVRDLTPAWAAKITGLSAETITAFARRYGATKRSFLRIGIGISRHDNGGMTCRTLACLPALTGAYADPHGGALLSSSQAYTFDFNVLERADLMPARAPRAINMIQLGQALTDPTLSPPVRALYVYNSNPAAICPNQSLVLKGLAREDLFTVVHEQVLTDTAHYADLVLPATTSMEHLDLYRSFGQLTLQLAQPVLPPQGEARSNWTVFQHLARALGVAGEHYAKSEEALIREFLGKGGPTTRGISYEQLERDGWARVHVPAPYLPFADGAPTPSGKVEFYAESLTRRGLPPLPTWIPLAEGPANGTLAARYPLQCIVPPNRFFLNSSFSQSALLRRRQQAPRVMMAAADAARRGLADGDRARVFNDRGSALFAVQVTDATQSGVVVIEGIWWHRFHPGDRNVNVLTSDRVADMGGGPAFHSNLVEIERG
jgi:anaerobic selenocysteine-containing dehydrogenase